MVSYFLHLDREGWQHDSASSAIRVRLEHNVYFAIGVQGTRPEKGRGKEAGVVSLPGFWADIDILGPNHAALALPPAGLPSRLDSSPAFLALDLEKGS